MSYKTKRRSLKRKGKKVKKMKTRNCKRCRRNKKTNRCKKMRCKKSTRRRRKLRGGNPLNIFSSMQHGATHNMGKLYDTGMGKYNDFTPSAELARANHQFKFSQTSIN